MRVPDSLLIGAVKTRFYLTSRAGASRQIRRSLQAYLFLSEQISPELGKKCVLCPQMPGVDEEMRDWSFFMILHHNAIVNRSITSIVSQLAAGQQPIGPGAINPKTDVLPSHTADTEQVSLFKTTVEDHLKTITQLSSLRGTLKKMHPVFGLFDAHEWHCMFAFHLQLHLSQARFVVKSGFGD